MHQGFKMDAGVEQQTAIAEGLNKIIFSAGGLALAAILVSALLDDDDYIGAFDFKARSDNELTETKNAGAQYIRIAGRWWSTQWLGPLGIPVSAMMEARKAKRKEGSTALDVGIGYAMGIGTGLAQFPGIKDVGDWYSSFGQVHDKLQKKSTTSTEKVAEAAKALHVTPEHLAQWISSRTVPAIAQQDVFGLAKPALSQTAAGKAVGLKDPYRYDALGRRLPHVTDDVWTAVSSFFVGSKVKYDTSNAVTDEFDKLNAAGALPTLADPDKSPNSKATKVKKAIGEDKYTERLNGLKKNFAREVEALIKTDDYKASTPAQKKKQIDKIRKDEIMTPLGLAQEEGGA
jgi:hypothetical protein